jgi:DNA (cytosine-5)-methyltransferase 1
MTIRALDLFCGAGGASSGLVAAGMEVTGVDYLPQPHYPYRLHFLQRNVGDLSPDFLRKFDFIWASPPCQRFSVATKRSGQAAVDRHPDWIPFTRQLLKESGKPYCIENVPGAPLIDPTMLCGSMFGNQTKHGSQLRRHRLFETSFPLPQLKCKHNGGSVIGVYGGGQHPGRRFFATIGVGGGGGLSYFTTQDRRDAMGIQWMTGKELTQAVPPSYSQWIAQRFLEAI